jgi:hypothetical protein
MARMQPGKNNGQDSKNKSAVMPPMKPETGKPKVNKPIVDIKPPKPVQKTGQPPQQDQKKQTKTISSPTTQSTKTIASKQSQPPKTLPLDIKKKNQIELETELDNGDDSDSEDIEIEYDHDEDDYDEHGHHHEAEYSNFQGYTTNSDQSTKNGDFATSLLTHNPERAFEALLSPLTIDDFMSAFYEKGPLVMERELGDYFNGIFNLNKDFLFELLTRQEESEDYNSLVSKWNETRFNFNNINEKIQLKEDLYFKANKDFETLKLKIEKEMEQPIEEFPFSEPKLKSKKALLKKATNIKKLPPPPPPPPELIKELDALQDRITQLETDITLLDNEKKILSQTKRTNAIEQSSIEKPIQFKYGQDISISALAGEIECDLNPNINPNFHGDIYPAIRARLALLDTATRANNNSNDIEMNVSDEDLQRAALDAMEYEISRRDDNRITDDDLPQDIPNLVDEIDMQLLGYYSNGDSNNIYEEKNCQKNGCETGKCQTSAPCSKITPNQTNIDLTSSPALFANKSIEQLYGLITELYHQKQEIKANVQYEQIINFLRAGCNIMLSQPQRFSTKIWRLIYLLETQFHTLVSSHLQIIPKHSMGTGKRFNESGCFILQLQGTSHLHLYKSLSQSPMNNNDHHHEHDPNGGCCSDSDEFFVTNSGPFKLGPSIESNSTQIPFTASKLSPGDFCYLPSGSIHQVVTTLDPPEIFERDLEDNNENSDEDDDQISKFLPPEQQSDSISLIISFPQQAKYSALFQSAFNSALEEAFGSLNEMDKILPLHFHTFLGSLHDPTIISGVDYEPTGVTLGSEDIDYDNDDIVDLDDAEIEEFEKKYGQKIPHGKAKDDKKDDKKDDNATKKAKFPPIEGISDDEFGSDDDFGIDDMDLKSELPPHVLSNNFSHLHRKWLSIGNINPEYRILLKKVKQDQLSDLASQLSHSISTRLVSHLHMAADSFNIEFTTARLPPPPITDGDNGYNDEDQNRDDDDYDGDDISLEELEAMEAMNPTHDDPETDDENDEGEEMGNEDDEDEDDQDEDDQDDDEEPYDPELANILVLNKRDQIVSSRSSILASTIGAINRRELQLQYHHKNRVEGIMNNIMSQLTENSGVRLAYPENLHIVVEKSQAKDDDDDDQDELIEMEEDEDDDGDEFYRKTGPQAISKKENHEETDDGDEPLPGQELFPPSCLCPEGFCEGYQLYCSQISRSVDLPHAPVCISIYDSSHNDRMGHMGMTTQDREAETAELFDSDHDEDEDEDDLDEDFEDEDSEEDEEEEELPPPTKPSKLSKFSKLAPKQRPMSSSMCDDDDIEDEDDCCSVGSCHNGGCGDDHDHDHHHHHHEDNEDEDDETDPRTELPVAILPLIRMLQEEYPRAMMIKDIDLDWNAIKNTSSGFATPLPLELVHLLNEFKGKDLVEKDEKSDNHSELSDDSDLSLDDEPSQRYQMLYKFWAICELFSLGFVEIIPTEVDEINHMIADEGPNDEDEDDELSYNVDPHMDYDEDQEEDDDNLDWLNFGEGENEGENEGEGYGSLYNFLSNGGEGEFDDFSDDDVVVDEDDDYDEDNFPFDDVDTSEDETMTAEERQMSNDLKERLKLSALQRLGLGKLTHGHDKKVVSKPQQVIPAKSQALTAHKKGPPKRKYGDSDSDSDELNEDFMIFDESGLDDGEGELSPADLMRLYGYGAEGEEQLTDLLNMDPDDDMNLGDFDFGNISTNVFGTKIRDAKLLKIKKSDKNIQNLSDEEVDEDNYEFDEDDFFFDDEDEDYDEDFFENEDDEEEAYWRNLHRNDDAVQFSEEESDVGDIWGSDDESDNYANIWDSDDEVQLAPQPKKAKDKIQISVVEDKKRDKKHVKPTTKPVPTPVPSQKAAMDALLQPQHSSNQKRKLDDMVDDQDIKHVNKKPQQQTAKKVEKSEPKKVAKPPHNKSNSKKK